MRRLWGKISSKHHVCTLLHHLNCKLWISGSFSSHIIETVFMVCVVCALLYVCSCTCLVKGSYWQQFHDCISIRNVFLFEFDAVCVCVLKCCPSLQTCFVFWEITCKFISAFVYYLIVCDEGVSHTAGAGAVCDLSVFVYPNSQNTWFLVHERSQEAWRASS